MTTVEEKMAMMAVAHPRKKEDIVSVRKLGANRTTLRKLGAPKGIKKRLGVNC